MGKANVKKIKFLTLTLAYSVLACVVEPFAWLRGKYEYPLQSFHLARLLSTSFRLLQLHYTCR